jgi:hypothetical protein
MRPNPWGTPGPGKIPPKKISVVRLTLPRNPIPAQSHPFPSLWPVDVRGQNIELELWEKTPASTRVRGGRRRARGGGDARAAAERVRRWRTEGRLRTATPPSAGRPDGVSSVAAAAAPARPSHPAVVFSPVSHTHHTLRLFSPLSRVS